MKKIILSLLFIIMLFSLCGCNEQSQYEQAKQAFERKNWEEVITITDKILSSKKSGNERSVIELNEQAKKELEIEKELSLVTELDREMLEYFMDTLYDANSLKLYGNILCIANDESAVMQLKYNSKNRSGGYVGVKNAEVFYGFEQGIFFSLDEDNNQFVDISIFFDFSDDETTDTLSKQFTTRVLNGEAIARLLDIVYVG